MPKILFQIDTLPIITEILQKNGIEDSDEVFLEKIKNGKLTQGETIFQSSEKIFFEKANQKVVCEFLKTNLNINDSLSKNIYDDILEKLIPFAVKPKNTLISQKSIIEPAKSEQTSKLYTAKNKIIKKTQQQTTATPEIKKTTPDNYREPIE